MNRLTLLAGGHTVEIRSGVTKVPNVGPVFVLPELGGPPGEIDDYYVLIVCVFFRNCGEGLDDAGLCAPSTVYVAWDACLRHPFEIVAEDYDHVPTKVAEVDLAGCVLVAHYQVRGRTVVLSPFRPRQPESKELQEQHAEHKQSGSHGRSSVFDSTIVSTFYKPGPPWTLEKKNSYPVITPPKTTSSPS